MASNDDGEVGYGKPPKAHQFRPGRSGNPRGRPPKRSQTPAQPVIQKVLRRRVQVTLDGRTQRISVGEAVMLQMIEQAARGKVAAQRFLMSAQAQMEAAEAKASSEPIDQGISVPQCVDLLEVVECLLSTKLLYMRKNGAFIFERSIISALLADGPAARPPFGPLNFLTGCRTEDAEAMEFDDGEALLDVFDRLGAERVEG